MYQIRERIEVPPPFVTMTTQAWEKHLLEVGRVRRFAGTLSVSLGIMTAIAILGWVRPWTI